MLSQSLNTSINRKRISDNSRAKRATRALLFMKKKQKRNDDDANDVFNVVDDFDAANEIEKNDDDEFAKDERDINEASNTMNDDEIARRETNDDEDFFRDVFRDRDRNNAFEKRKRTSCVSLCDLFYDCDVFFRLINR
jgi:hypothetical protein